MILSQEFTLLNKTGLHARPAANLVKLVSDSNAKIEIDFNNKIVDGKSFISIISLGAEKGSKIKVTVNGPDAQETLQKIKELVDNKFGDEE